MVFGTVQLGFDHEGEPKYGEYGTVPAKWEWKESVHRCEFFALRNLLERALLPLTVLTDNLGVDQGLDRGEVRCTSDKHPNADEWIKKSGVQKN